VLPGAGDGTFPSVTTYNIGGNSGALAMADFNGDGSTDIAVTTPTGASVLLGIVRPATTTTLTSSLNPTKLHQPVTLTATLSDAIPTGSVTFYDGTTTLATNTLVNGQATLTTGALSTGTHSLTAYFPGYAEYSASTSAALTETVSGTIPQAGITLTSSANPARFGQAVTLTRSSGSSIARM